VKSKRTKEFKELFSRLPSAVQKLAAAVYKVFATDPNAASLHSHPLKDTAKGRHRLGSIAVWINQKYRAVYVVDGDTAVWYWCGSHNDYENFTGVK
jgi:hypothetical protein